jgi:hypothetical protein
VASHETWLRGAAPRRDYNPNVSRRIVPFLVAFCACHHAGDKTASTSANAAAGAAVKAAGEGRPPPTVTGPKRMIDGRYFVADGAPDPLWCSVDRDCIGDAVTDESGCCVASPDSFPQNWSWHVWISQRRLSQACDGVSCSPVPAGKLPRSCRLAAACKAGRCADACVAGAAESEQPKHE